MAEEKLLLCGNKKLIYDEACLHIKNEASAIIDIQYQSTECFQCSFQPFMQIFNGEIKTEVMKTSYGTTLLFPFNNSLYRNTYFFEQHGHYGINITKSVVSELFDISPPASENGPLFTLLWTLIIGWILWSIGCYILTCTQFYARLFQPRLIVNEAENDLGAISRSGDSTPLLADMAREICTRKRIKSLDVFRGITISLMLFVNYGGGKYWFFQHSTWNGLTIADVIFPWFAWIMGASMMLSLSSHLRNSLPRNRIFLKVLLRSVALVAIGIILNSIKNNNVVTLRFPGVLQRLGLSYLIVGSLETTFITIQNNYNINGIFKRIEDWIYSWCQWIIMFAIIGIYCICIFCINVPGCTTGYLGPGGLHKNSSYINCTGGSAGYIDRQIFTTKHLYNDTQLSSVYHNKLAFDPEGLLGTLSTALTVFLGVHASRITLCYSCPRGRLTRWLILAVITGLAAGHLCGWSKEEGSIPLNKHMWSLSFALATSSLAFFMESILFFLIDFKGWWSGSPFHQIGKNAIFVYVGSIITKEAIPWNWKPIDYTTHSQILWMNFWSTSLWIIIAIFLDLGNVYISI